MLTESDQTLSDAASRASDVQPVAAITVDGLAKRYRFDVENQDLPHQRLYRWAPRMAKRLVRRATRGRPDEKTRKSQHRDGWFWALDHVSFEIKRGERVGVIGRNGAGKSTLLKILSRVVQPTAGQACIRGRVTSLLEVGTGINPALTGKTNIYTNAAMHGFTKKQTDEIFHEIVEFSGLDERFINMRVRNYSSGMKVRLAFSVAAHLDPDIMLMDEVLAVGDLAFQQKCLERVEGMMGGDRTVMFVSHGMNAVTRFCERAIWIEQGKVVMDGPSLDVVTAYTDRMQKSITVGKWQELEDDLPMTSDELAHQQARQAAADEPVSDSDQDSEMSGVDIGDHVKADTKGRTLGDEARLLSACFVDHGGREINAATVDQPVWIEFVYDVYEDGWLVLPAAAIFNEDDIKLFTAVCTEEPYVSTPRPPGRYRSRVKLPEHFFNVGKIDATVILNAPTSAGLRNFTIVEKAISLQYYEAPLEAGSASGAHRSPPGVIRPLLEWATTDIGKDDD